MAIAKEFTKYETRPIQLWGKMKELRRKHFRHIWQAHEQGQLPCRRHKLRQRRHSVEQAHPVTLLGVNVFPGEHHLHGLALSHEPGQAQRPPHKRA